MNEPRHEELRRVFDLVLEVPADERASVLERECGGDAGLKERILAMIAAAEDEQFLGEATVVGSHSADQTIHSAGRERAGDQVGRYKLLEQIGEGGFGSVWAAEQREPVKRRVALKIIKLGMDTKQVIARFEAERQALALMDHPNIAKVLDAGSTDTGRPFFVMELVKGVPILDYCDTEKLDTRARLELFMKVCHAIQHAHQKGIIHRDIKPTNVLITLHDGVPVPKVIDFGIAKATNQELTNKTIYTEHRQMIGTPAYMSPEQAEMSGLDIDTRSDIYSLGVLLYELLTGTTPFDTKSLMEAGFAEMMRIIRETEPHKPSTRLSSLGNTATRTAEQRRVDVHKLSTQLRGDLDWIVMKCLEKDRTRRYETANGLAADIVRHLSDEPVLAGPPSAKYKLAKFIKRNRGQVIAGGVVAAALVLGVVGTSAGMAWALKEKDRADTEATNASLAAAAEKEARLDAEANEQKAKAEAERAERELARATEIKRLITEMLQSVDPEEAQGADTTLLKGILDDASQRLAKGEITDELIAAELHQVVGRVYRQLALYSEAEAHTPLAFDIRARVLGEDDPKTLDSMAELGLLCLDQRRYAEAEPLLAQCSETRGRVLGKEHPETIGSMQDLGRLFLAQKRYAEAEPLLLESLEMRRRILGNEHKDTITAIGNQSALYWNSGRRSEAEPLLIEVWEALRRTVGEDHPDTLQAMNNVGVMYRELGRYAEAEPILTDCLEKRRRVMGAEHPKALESMNNLALLHSAQARYAAVEPLFVETLGIQRRRLGDEHPDTLQSMNKLASLYMVQGRYAEAEPLFLEKLEVQKRVLGDEHPDTLQSMIQLGILYTRQGRYAEAEPLRLETLTMRRRVLGEEHPDTLGITTDLGNLYNVMERYEEAAAMLERSLPIMRRVLGVDHPWTAVAMSGLATAYEHLGRHAEALPLRRELLELQTAKADSPDADAATLNGAAWILLTHDTEELRDPQRALGYAERACALEEAANGANLWMYLDTLALAQHATGDNAAAVVTQKRAIALMPSPDADPGMADRLAEYEAALATNGDGDQP